ncbi:MAG: archease [Candidatus Krumholzibacteria bacterium]|nr:archease [Candidatus Krumholzibacteria bacterium]
MSSRGHETLDHTADMGIRGWGASASEAFEETAAAMFELILDTSVVEASQEIVIYCEGSELEYLLVEFLNAIISKSDIEEIAFVSVDIVRMEVVDGKWVIEAIARGLPRSLVVDGFFTEVKAATYCGVAVREIVSGAWEAQCIVDL